MKNNFLFYFFSFLFIIMDVYSYAQMPVNASQRKSINLDDNWKFSLGNASNPEKDFNFRIANVFVKSGGTQGTAIDPKYKDSAWRNLQLPHDWAVELPFVNSPNLDVMSHGYKPVGGLFPETSIGWYRKHFTVSKADSGQHFELQFDGIFRDALIWINGFYVGNNKSGYRGVSFDIANYLQYDRDNVVSVRVDASQYEGWFYEGAGIYRHVWLNQYNNVHISTDGVFVYSKVTNKNALVSIETTVQNEAFNTASSSITTIIADRNGKIITQSSEHAITLNTNETKTIKLQISVPNAILWSLENPYLYRAIIVVKSGGTTIDSKTIKFGIRTISISNKGLFLNGVPIKVKGTNNHQDHAGVGSALPDYLQYYRIHLLKEMGSNAYRTSHNPPTPELLDACDSLGMLVLDENRFLNSSPQYLSDFEWLLKRDRSRASVFMWSIGNEEGWVQTTPTGRLIAQTLLAKQQLLDPTRVSTYAADLPNIFKGINEVIPVRGFNYRQNAVADYHKDHPLQPILGTEMGSTVTTRGIYFKDSIHAYVPDQDITAPWWASTAEEWWKLAAPNDYWAGGFVWTGFDYRGEPTPYQWPNINSHFGIMDMCGFPKNIYYYYQSWWTDKEVLHISPHWNWKGNEGQPIDVWVNSNADNVELFLNGSSLGKKEMPRNSHLQWSVPFKPGTLEAIAFKKGKKITAKIETTGAAVEIVVTPYKTTLLANGTDATVINISAIDSQGREVPDANNLIHFSLKGDAKIIGVGNGDPSSHEADKIFGGKWQRQLFNGKSQVILQSGNRAGIIHFDAKADSLQTGSTDLHSIHSGRPQSVVTAKHLYPISKGVGGPVTKILGADISFLPQLESSGIKFSDKGVEKDAILILKEHGFNYIRLRIFNDPATDSGYSPKKGFCDLEHTKQMAKRIKDLGMKLLLDFHYSDTWADPGKQFKPAAWMGQPFDQLCNSVYDYTKAVMLALKDQGTSPDMVQVGNEINHGMIWPDGRVGNFDNLSLLIYAGINGIRAIEPSTIIMLHIALGGQNDESRFFLDNALARGLPFDVIGLSYYPKWHGTLADLQYNMNDLAKRYKKDLILVEYSELKKEVNDIAFQIIDGRGKGTFIWEPLNTWEKVFENNGKSNEFLLLYDEIRKKFIAK